MQDSAKNLINSLIIYSMFFILFIALAIVAKVEVILVFLLFSLFAYVKIRESKKIKKTNILNVGFLLLIGISIEVFLKRVSGFSPYYIPIPAIAMLIVILFSDLELALLVSLFLSVFLGFLYNADSYLIIVMFLSSITGSFFVLNIRQRSKIIQAGFLVSFVMLVSLTVLAYRRDIGFSYFFSPNITPAFLNGILSAFLVAGSLPIFEFLFRVVTNISLLELSDFNHPLLKRLILEAPGTYHHSLLVGNLAELAAEAVGANSLLARVGAYYHDIGKLNKPEYFSENQEKTFSLHDQLKASMSKLVIINHVKEGLELAEKYKLNSSITDFIGQHHGTSLVFYFYRRAIEETSADEDVKEDVFRYPGPKPQTKEAAIVLLADSVEAACRALDEPNSQRIEEVVHTIINNKFIDGQLDECFLSLKDLDNIAKTFIRILSAIYHTRVEYHDKKSENRNKESSKKNQN